MASETARLKLKKVELHNGNWKDDEDSNKDILDANPGIAPVDDGTAMAALDTWEGRMCWRKDLDVFYVYDGEAWGEFDIEAYTDVDNFYFRESYNEAIIYHKYNLVLWDEDSVPPQTDEELIGTYICITEESEGIEDIPPSNTNHWALIAPATAGPQGEPGEDGADGADGEPGPQGPEGSVEGVVGPKKSATQETPSPVSAEGNLTGSITFQCSPHTGGEVILLMVKISPFESVDGFKFQLFSSESDRDAGTNPVYELDTSEGEYSAGDEVRDPNGGFDTVSYYIDEDAGEQAEEGSLWYKVENLDEALSSKFTIDIDYKALV